MFISKYLKAMEEDNGYEKLIVFPPPLNILLLPLMLAYPSRRLVKLMAEAIGRFWFWFSNMFFIMAFFVYMVSHNPIVMCRIYYQILTKIDGCILKFSYLLGWSLFGWLYLLYTNTLDTFMLTRILYLEGSTTADPGEDKHESLEF